MINDVALDVAAGTLVPGVTLAAVFDTNVYLQLSDDRCDRLIECDGPSLRQVSRGYSTTLEALHRG
jgi:hypothetical protein